jgi:transcriptional regulator with XRE-family HTH domain
MTPTLRDWLAAQMEERNIGRNELARRAGVAAGTVSRIMLYGHVPKADTVCKIADVFGADRDTVLEIAGIVELSDLPLDVPPEVRDLARRLYRLPTEERLAIIRHFDGILQLVERRRSDEA